MIKVTGKDFNYDSLPPPPVCTVNWNETDWEKYKVMYGIETEPETITNSFGIWKKIDKVDGNGDALYNLTFITKIS